jgi:hypothetical protein
VTGTGVSFAWNKATDAQTLQNGISYNIYIGNAPGTTNKKPALSSIPGGYRRIPIKGQIQNNSWTARRLPAGVYYWSVQAIDNSFSGSPFATEGTFTIPFSLSVSPAADQVIGVNQDGTPLTVTESIAPASRQWKYSASSGGSYQSIPELPG